MTARPFRFGVQAYAPESPDAWRTLARRAETLGYSALHLADHYIGPGPALDPTNHPVQVVAAIPAMAVAVEATTEITIGARVLCIDYHQPVVLAKELATIAWFAGDRLEVGFGAGWLEAEYDAMGIAFDPAPTRVDRLAETTALMRACFAGGAIDVAGAHVNAHGFTAVPALAHAPRIMLGGGSPRVLRMAGALADIVSLNFDNRSGRIGPEGFTSGTADRTDEKLAWVREGAGDRFDDVELEIASYLTMVSDDRDSVLEGMAPMFGLTPEDLAQHPHTLVGSTEQIAETLIERRERFGIAYVTVGVDVLEAFAPVVERLAGT